MKKLILIISLFVAGSSFCQDLYVTNNTGNSINYRYYEVACPFTNSSTTYGLVAYGTARHAITTGFTEFYAFYSEDASTSQQAPLLFDDQGLGCLTPPPITTVSCPFTIPCTATWNIIGGDVYVEFN